MKALKHLVHFDKGLSIEDVRTLGMGAEGFSQKSKEADRRRGWAPKSGRLLGKRNYTIFIEI